MNLEGRIANDADATQLATMNHQLIRDEGHRNSMSAAELEDRMRDWLRNEYQATIFMVDESTAGYALYKQERDWIYLRQFFILPELRHRGYGRAGMQWLFHNQWRDGHRIRVDVLIGNTDGISFWRSVGFQDYCITMEIDTLPQDHYD
jgi:predicted acetyltransferase